MCDVNKTRSEMLSLVRKKSSRRQYRTELHATEASTIYQSVSQSYTIMIAPLVSLPLPYIQSTWIGKLSAGGRGRWDGKSTGCGW